MVLAAISYSCSTVLPYPLIYQLLAVICLTWLIVIAAGYLLRDFSTALIEDGERMAILRVTESCGKRQTVVARFTVDEIKSVKPFSREEVRAVRRRGHPVYRYVSELQPENACILEAESRGQTFWMVFYADQTLVDLLNVYKKQYLSEI